MVGPKHESTTVTRSFAVWMLATLLLVCSSLWLAPSAFADDANSAPQPILTADQLVSPQANKTETINVNFPAGTNSTSDIQVPLSYSDTEFFTTKATQYNDKLGYASVCLAAAAGYSNVNSAAGYAGRDVNIKNFLTNIGCSDVTVNEAYGVEPMTRTNIGCAIGHKTITVTEGAEDQTYELFVVGVRGINYEAEWAANFMVGESGEHQGFQDARDTVLAFIMPYIQQKAPQGSKVKIWIAGYSRAGATTNLVGGWLDKWIYQRNNNGTLYPNTDYTSAYNAQHTVRAGDFDPVTMRHTGTMELDPTTYASGVTFSVDDVYCYPVSAPLGAMKDDVKKHQNLTTNIHSILNPDDWITQIAMEWWGFARYGTAQDHDISGAYPDGTIESSKHDISVAAQQSGALNAMLARLKKINPDAAYTAPWFKQYYLSYWKGESVVDNTTSGIKYADLKTNKNGKQGAYYEEFLKYFLDGAGVKNRAAYASTCQEDLMYLIKYAAGLPSQKQARFKTTFKTQLQAALRTELKRPELDLSNLGTMDKVLALKLVAYDEPGLTRVIHSTFASTLQELGVTYDDAKLSKASATLARMMKGSVQTDIGYFYHLVTIAKNLDGIEQAHMPEVILAWWEGADANPASFSQKHRTVKFYNKKGDTDPVFSVDVRENGKAYISPDKPEAMELDTGGVGPDGVHYYNAPTQPGYAFDGWETAAGNSAYAPEDELVYEELGELDAVSGQSAGPAVNVQSDDKGEADVRPADETGDIVLYASWSDEAVYTLNYHANNGSTADDYTDYANATDEKLPISQNEFTNKNYTFKGWNTEADGTGTLIPAGGEANLSDLGLLSTSVYHSRLTDDITEEAYNALLDSQTRDLYAQWDTDVPEGEGDDPSGGDSGSDSGDPSGGGSGGDSGGGSGDPNGGGSGTDSNANGGNGSNVDGTGANGSNVGSSSNGATTKGTSTNTGSSTSGSAKAPGTGDTLMPVVIGIAVVAIIAVMALLAARKKRK